MKTLIISVFLLFGLFLFVIASPSNGYQLDDDKIEAEFDRADKIEVQTLIDEVKEDGPELVKKEIKKHKQLRPAGDDQVAAILLCIFLGGIGIHRLYLGSGLGVAFLYCITGAGCSILFWVDLVLLIVEGTDRYVGNRRFIAFL